MSNKLITIMGPTAAGKTSVSLKLAKKFNGEIVSADSRQIYKGMNIGTATPTEEEMNGIPHYLFSLKDPDEEMNVVLFKKLAVEKIKEIQKKEKLPFLVGGTGLYIKAVTQNLQFPGVGPQPEIRNKLEKKSTEELFDIYKRLDPKGAKNIDKNNPRRLIRAIEVSKTKDKPFSQIKGKGAPLFDILKIGIKIKRRKLKKKIAKRVEEMFNKGLKKEVEKLYKKYGFNISSMQTIGYQEWEDYFKGEKSKDEVKEEIIIHTRQFAKKQMTWFRKTKNLHWVKKEKQAEKLIKKFLE